MAGVVGGLRLGQLRLVYQPVVGLRDGEVVACEALVRWERPGVGLVGPERFVPIAERAGLIVELGAWVIGHAVAEAATGPGAALMAQGWWSTCRRASSTTRTWPSA